MRVHCGQHGGAQKNYATKGRQAGRRAGCPPRKAGRQAGTPPGKAGRQVQGREAGMAHASLLTRENSKARLR
jgi:hypothetical protein